MKKIRTKFVMYGFRFPFDRPEDCVGCPYWDNRRTGCMMTGSYTCPTLLKMLDQLKKCEGCPYAKNGPCVSAACYKDLVSDLKRREKTG